MTHAEVIALIEAAGFTKMDGDIVVDVFTAPEECGDAIPAIVLIKSQNGVFAALMDMSQDDLLDAKLLPFEIDIVLAEGDMVMGERAERS